MFYLQKPSECCTGAELIDESALAECQAEYPAPSDGKSHGPGRRGGHPCIIDCYFNKTGIFKDGQPVKSVALDVLGKSSDASITDLLNAGLDKCIATQADHQARMKERSNGRFPPGDQPPNDSSEMDQKRCRPEAKFFLKCVQFYVYKNCPQDKVVSTEECVQFDAFTEKCMPPMMQ